MRCLQLFLMCLTLWAAPARAETPIDLAPCLGMIALLPDDIAALDPASCAEHPSTQIRAVLVYHVPAETADALADRLVADYAMAPLRFVCCGYETAQPGLVAIPDGHFPRSLQQQLTGNYDAIQTVLQISLSTPAFPIGASIEGAPLPLGALPGLLTLTLLDV